MHCLWKIAAELEVRTRCGEVQTFETGRLERRVVGLAAREIGLMVDEAQAVPGTLVHAAAGLTPVPDRKSPGHSAEELSGSISRDGHSIGPFRRDLSPR